MGFSEFSAFTFYEAKLVQNRLLMLTGVLFCGKVRKVGEEGDPEPKCFRIVSKYKRYR